MQLSMGSCFQLAETCSWKAVLKHIGKTIINTQMSKFLDSLIQYSGTMNAAFVFL